MARVPEPHIGSRKGRSPRKPPARRRPAARVSLSGAAPMRAPPAAPEQGVHGGVDRHGGALAPRPDEEREAAGEAGGLPPRLFDLGGGAFPQAQVDRVGEAGGEAGEKGRVVGLGLGTAGHGAGREAQLAKLVAEEELEAGRGGAEIRWRAEGAAMRATLTPSLGLWRSRSAACTIGLLVCGSVSMPSACSTTPAGSETTGGTSCASWRCTPRRTSTWPTTRAREGSGSTCPGSGSPRGGRGIARLAPVVWRRRGWSGTW